MPNGSLYINKLTHKKAQPDPHPTPTTSPQLKPPKPIPKMSNPPTIIILPASPEDAPTLTRIHGDAFQNSTLLDLMFGPPTEENLKGFTAQLAELIANDKTARFTKAVDNDTNKIVGWSWWNIFPDHKSRLEGSEAFAKDHTDPPESAISPEAYREYFRGVEERREKWVGGRAVVCEFLFDVFPLDCPCLLKCWCFFCWDGFTNSTTLC